MYIFLDEAGDLGFEINNGSSTYFVITLLVCNDIQTVRALKAAVKHTLAHKLNNKNHRKRFVRELKSTHTNLDVKNYFLQNLLGKQFQNWYLHSIICNKILLHKKADNSINKHHLYNILTRNIFDQLDFTSCNNNIYLVVDKCKSRKERNIFNQYLKMNLKVKLPTNVNIYIDHELSHNHTGLQAVDIFCGGILRKYQYQDTSWYNLFKHKIKTEILYR